MAVTAEQIEAMLRLGARRQWLLEVDYVWPTWRAGLTNVSAGATNTAGVIEAEPIRAITDTAVSSTVATNYLLPTTAQTLVTASIIHSAGARLLVTPDRGLRVFAVGADATVDTTFTGPLVSLDTLHAVRMEVDRSSDVIRVYVDNSQVGTDVDISTIGDFKSGFFDITNYGAWVSLFSFVEGVQGFDRILDAGEIARLNTPTPPARINGWAEIMVPTAEQYINATSHQEVEAQFVDLLQNQAVSFLVATLSNVNTFEAQPSSTAGPYTAYYALDGWASGPADSPANQPYDGRMLAPPLVSQINEDHYFGITRERISGVELRNEDGELDFWRWVTVIDQGCTLLVGAPGWALADYLTITGKVLGVATSADAVQLEMGGLTSLLEHRANPSETVPICIGNVEGAKPGPDFTWRGEANSGVTLCTLDTVRDRGASVGFTDDADGSFTLSAAQVGEITYDTVGWKGDNVVDSDQTYGLDGVLKQFLLHHTELAEAELDLPSNATLAYPNYLIESFSDQRAYVGGVYVEPGSDKTAFEVAGEIGRSALSLVSGISGQITMTQPSTALPTTEIHAISAEKITSLAIRRGRDGLLEANYARNPTPLSDVASDTAGSSIWRREYLFLSSYGADAVITGEYPFAPYRETFTAPWLRSFDPVDGSPTDLEIKFQRKLGAAFAEETGLWRIDLAFLPWNIDIGTRYRVFAPEFSADGAVCLVTGRVMGDDNYLLALTNGH